MLKNSNETMMLKERIKKVPTPGAKKIHGVIPTSKSKVQIKVFLEAGMFNNTWSTQARQTKEYQAEDIGILVMCEHDRKMTVCYM
jgi:hypothetical protein